MAELYRLNRLMCGVLNLTHEQTFNTESSTESVQLSYAARTQLYDEINKQVDAYLAAYNLSGGE